MDKLRTILVIIGGVILLLFGLFHMNFWGLFNWEKELLNLNQINSNIMQMLNIGMIVFLLSFGFILILYHKEILETIPGKAILITIALFFIVRLIAEFVFPGSSITLGYILFICVFIYLIPVFKKTKH